MSLHRRIRALECKRGDGLSLVLIERLPAGEPGARETATYEGVTFTQEADESADQFRGRLENALKDRGRFIWVSELDAAL